MERASRWRTVLVTIIITIAVCGAAVVTFIYAGIYNVAATAPHSPLSAWALNIARTRSIQGHAAGIQVPMRLDDQSTVIAGTEHFAAHCAVCHGAPGVPKGDIAQGMYPTPPDLAVTAKTYTPAELFWILKNGIKMTGMPSWGDHSDDELWATVALLRKLPGMSETEYAKLLQASMAQGGHHHDGH